MTDSRRSDFSLKNDTLIRYLVNELTAIEHDHRDALRPVPIDAELSFMGDHILKQPTTAGETRELHESLERSFMSGIRGLQTDIWNITVQLENMPLSTRAPPGQTSVFPTDHDPPAPTSRTRICPPRKLPIPGLAIPNLPRRCQGGAWQVAVEQWETIDPLTGYALKDWPEDWYKGEMTNVFGSKWCQRELIATEFIEYDHPSHVSNSGCTLMSRCHTGLPTGMKNNLFLAILQQGEVRLQHYSTKSEPQGWFGVMLHVGRARTAYHCSVCRGEPKTMMGMALATNNISGSLAEVYHL
jgi:hypothetical protein